MKVEKSVMNVKLPVCCTQPLAPSSFDCSAGHSRWMQASCLSFPGIIMENAHNDCLVNNCTWFARRSERLDPWLILSLDLVSGMFVLANVCFTGSLRCVRECVSYEQQQRSVLQGFIGSHKLKCTIGIHVITIDSMVCRTGKRLDKRWVRQNIHSHPSFQYKKYSQMWNSKLNLCGKYTIY